MQFDVQNWYQPRLNLLTGMLLPFSWLYGLLTALRRTCYRRKILSSSSFDVPVIVVGNITAGGTGKTPCVIALTSYLKSIGYHPGIVARGVGGVQQYAPRMVTESADANVVGDEAVMLARQCHVPVVIGIDRVAAVSALLGAHATCDIVISDDGLQHYRLGRDIEIAVVDGSRHFGNGYLLPSGPLREPRARLSSVDYVIVNSGVMDDAYAMKTITQDCVPLLPRCHSNGVASLMPGKVHAVAGIGNPQRFFQSLRLSGYSIIEHVFPDHHPYKKSDLEFDDTLPIIMTEKDAVKCIRFADDRMWYSPIAAQLDTHFLEHLKIKLKGIK